MGTNFDHIRAYIEGDDHALQMLFFKQGFSSLVFAKAFRLVWHPDKEGKARMVVSDVFMSLVSKSLEERTHNFEGKTVQDFRNYLLSMANNKAVDINRREKNIVFGINTPEGHEPPHDMDKIDETEEKLKRVRECASQTLSALDYEVYDFWLWKVYSEQKLMQHFGWSDKELHTVKVRIMRRLRNCLGIGN
jgi:DNA-directed RNA polymerase specialized sigma24 family protein